MSETKALTQETKTPMSETKARTRAETPARETDLSPETIIRASKIFARLLRHDTIDYRRDLRMDRGGFVSLNALAWQPELRRLTLTLGDLETVALASDGRYEVREDKIRGDIFKVVRATYGHCPRVARRIDESLLYTRLTIPVDCSFWCGSQAQADDLVRTGLVTEKYRMYILLGSSDDSRRGMFEVQLDMARAMKDGIDFYSSKPSRIISTSGIDGVLPGRYLRIVPTTHDHDHNKTQASSALGASAMTAGIPEPGPSIV